MINDDKKFFTDLLKQYEKLKYIFEYGFKWDRNITKLLYENNQDNYTRWNNIIGKFIYENIRSIPYDEVNQVKNTASPSRKLVLKRPYSLGQNFWFQHIYGCYGMTDKEYCQNIQCDNGSAKYVKKCPYKLIYEIRLKAILLEKIKEGVSIKNSNIQNACVVRCGADCDSAIKNVIKWGKRLHENYPDMIKEVDGKISLKENQWTEEKIKKVFPGERYKYFIEWISFFSSFAPLSVLGSNFLWKMRKPIDNHIFFIRGLNHEIGLEQESIYRCLCAIKDKKQLKYDGKLYHPIRLIYMDNQMDVENASLYLIAQRKGKISYLPIKEHYICVTEKNWTENIEINQKDCWEKEEKFTEYTVDFYTNSMKKKGELTEYLNIRRRKGFWSKSDTTSLDSPEIFIGESELSSPYYPKNYNWETYRKTYQIKQSDQEGFKRYIMSFGEFARLHGTIGNTEKEDNNTVILDTEEDNDNYKVEKQEKYSLCNIFTAKGILEMNPHILELSKLRDMTFPPSEAEIEWIRFILECYPNMSRIFLTEKECDGIRKKIEDFYQKELIEKQDKKWFNENLWNFKSKVVDCREKAVQKYQKIYSAIQKNTLFRYIHKKEVIVLPYAMEYNVTRHMEFKNEEPFQIMCYDWKAKRNCLIKYNDIKVEKVIEMEEFKETITIFDKLYHALAYVVRNALEGNKRRTVEFSKNITDMLKCLYEPDNRSKESNYIRCIYKKINKYNKEYCDIYEKKEKILEENDRKKEIEEFFENVFDYWKDPEQKAGKLEMKYHTFLLECFLQACKVLKTSRKGKKLLNILDQIKAEDVFGWLLQTEQIQETKNIKRDNDDKDEEDDDKDIVGEIAYYNERLKRDEVTFCLVQNKRQYIETVYDVFKQYICTGDIKNDKIYFTVTYERFNYRDIHKNLMALRDIIEIDCIEPEEEKDIIQRRIAAIKTE